MIRQTIKALLLLGATYEMTGRQRAGTVNEEVLGIIRVLGSKDLFADN